MKSLFWHQNPSNSGDDLLYVNGESITPPSNPIYANGFSTLLKEIKREEYINTSMTVLYKSKYGYTLKGNLENKDVIGRRIPFIFYSEEKSVKCFINQFKKLLSDSNLRYSREECELIVNKTSQKESFNKVVCISAITIAIIILIIILK